MLNVITDEQQIKQYFLDNLTDNDLFSRKMVILSGREGPEETLPWCQDQQENITCLPTRLRPEILRDGTIVFAVVSQKYNLYIFESQITAIQFKLIFCDYVFDYWVEAEFRNFYTCEFREL